MEKRERIISSFGAGRRRFRHEGPGKVGNSGILGPSKIQDLGPAGNFSKTRPNPTRREAISTHRAFGGQTAWKIFPLASLLVRMPKI